ncbi:MAG: hypothetical protein H6Q80_367 [Deltaproteobacteria bacterium]|jgi:hypothetical protein|nr:hypothetical protein [Deltaproteobacteria bacterium]MBP2685105.1 hypothetical protein [Deltaproteobacteria bacterium]
MAGKRTGCFFAQGWAISPLVLFLVIGILFLVLFPMVLLDVERDPEYERLLMVYGIVHLAGLILGGSGRPLKEAIPAGKITAPPFFFRACWIFWGLMALYKTAMLFLGGIARYQHEESEALFQLPYAQMILDSLAFRLAPFIAWVASGGRIGPLLILAVLVDILFGVATLTKEFALYVIVAAAFGFCYWRRSPSMRIVATGAVATVLVFLIGPALVWTRFETVGFSSPLEVVSGIAENLDKTLADDVQRGVTFLAAQERFDLYSAGQLAFREEEFERTAQRARDALPLFWLPRSEEKEITFRSGNYLGASVGLAEEGDISGVAFPNMVVLQAMFGFPVGVALCGGLGFLFGAAFHRIRQTRFVEDWMGYVLLYLDVALQLYIGLPFPAIPYKVAYDLAAWCLAILMLRALMRFSSRFAVPVV